MSIIRIKKIISYISFGLLAMSIVQGSFRTKHADAAKGSEWAWDDDPYYKGRGFFQRLQCLNVCDRNGHLNSHATKKDYDKGYIAFFEEISKRGHMSGDIAEDLWNRSNKNLNARDAKGKTALDYTNRMRYEDRIVWSKYLRFDQIGSRSSNGVRTFADSRNRERPFNGSGHGHCFRFDTRSHYNSHALKRHCNRTFSGFASSRNRV
ncbi:MAG: hypothetical protein LBS71_02355 [Puniceicoccales bacterium]|nr:hypothetical protein [Puniceicoccales bacterium]